MRQAVDELGNDRRHHLIENEGILDIRAAVTIKRAG